MSKWRKTSILHDKWKILRYLDIKLIKKRLDIDEELDIVTTIPINTKTDENSRSGHEITQVKLVEDIYTSA